MAIAADEVRAQKFCRLSEPKFLPPSSGKVEPHTSPVSLRAARRNTIPRLRPDMPIVIVNSCRVFPCNSSRQRSAVQEQIDMTTQLHIPGYVTDQFFGLEDRWLETAEGELTHYHDIGEGTPILFLHGSGTGVTAAANWL